MDQRPEVVEWMEKMGWAYKANKGGTYYWQKFNGIYKSQMGIKEAEEFYRAAN
jgi:hypothetical protein